MVCNTPRVLTVHSTAIPKHYPLALLPCLPHSCAAQSSVAMAAESIAMLPWTISSSIPSDHRLLPRGLSVSHTQSSGLSRNCVVARYSATQSSLLCSNHSLRKCLPPLKALVTAENKTANTTPLTGDDKVGVLLLNLGGPETLDDVQPFLFNLFADPVTCSSSCLLNH